jgi:hypothetical protein
MGDRTGSRVAGVQANDGEAGYFLDVSPRLFSSDVC